MNIPASLSIHVRDLRYELRPGKPTVWRCIVTLGGVDTACDTLYGSWRTTPEPDDTRSRGRHLHTDIAVQLQELVHKAERQHGLNHHGNEQKENTMSTTETPEKAGAKPAGKKPAAKTKAAGKRAGKAAAKPAAKATKTTGAANAATERNMAAVLAAVPKGVKEAMNANAIAKALSDKAGKTVWPIPTKNYLEKLVADKKAKKTERDGKTLYYT